MPWTTLEFPDWLKKLIPLSIEHRLKTYRGDDRTWAERVQKTGVGMVEKKYIYFTDMAGLVWDGKLIDTTLSETLEMYIGPALMCFHIPFDIGIFKVLVATTPVNGGSIMRVKTYVNSTAPHVRFIAWLLQGLSSSQLFQDIDILENKVRLNKPLLQPFDGPYNRTNAWLKQFYSESTGTTDTIPLVDLEW